MPSDITLLVLGCTTDGKSTFVNRLRHLSSYNGSEAAAPVGQGSVSTTKTCNANFHFSFPLTDYKLMDRNGREINLPSNNDDRLLSHLGKYIEGEAIIAPTTEDYDMVQVRVIDTPGLDDTHGDDLSNILSVLETLDRLRRDEGDKACVNAVIFVTNANLAYSDSFQTIWKYYEACMPNLFCGAVVVNTKFTVARWKQKQRQYNSKTIGKHLNLSLTESVGQRTLRERRHDFAAVMEGRDPQQFFIDNRPDPDDLIEELISMNNMYEIMNLLAKQGPMKIGEMRFVKSAANITVDIVIQKKLQQFKALWAEKKRILLDQISLEERQCSLLHENIMNLKYQIERCQEELSRINNGNEFALGNYTIEEDTSAANVLTKMITFRHFENTMDISDKRVDEFYVQFIDAPGARWTKTEWLEASKTWRGTWKADWAKCPLLKARAYTQNSIIHAKLIADKETEMRSCDMKLTRSESELQLLPAKANLGLDELTERITQCQDVLCKLEPETVSLEVGLDEAARKRYKKAPVLIEHCDVVDAVRPFQPDLAAILEKHRALYY